MFEKKFQFISLDLLYSKNLNVNKLINTTFSTIAEFETNSPREREMQRISAAKKLENIEEEK